MAVFAYCPVFLVTKMFPHSRLQRYGSICNFNFLLFLHVLLSLVLLSVLFFFGCTSCRQDHGQVKRFIGLCSFYVVLVNLLKFLHRALSFEIVRVRGNTEALLLLRYLDINNIVTSLLGYVRSNIKLLAAKGNKMQ